MIEGISFSHTSSLIPTTYVVVLVPIGIAFTSAIRTFFEYLDILAHAALLYMNTAQIRKCTDIISTNVLQLTALYTYVDTVLIVCHRSLELFLNLIHSESNREVERE